MSEEEYRAKTGVCGECESKLNSSNYGGFCIACGHELCKDCKTAHGHHFKPLED